MHCGETIALPTDPRKDSAGLHAAAHEKAEKNELPNFLDTTLG
jgi:hypothetical protein